MCGFKKKNVLGFFPWTLETFRNKLGKKIKRENSQRLDSREDMDDGDDGVPHLSMQNIETGKIQSKLEDIV